MSHFERTRIKDAKPNIKEPHIAICIQKIRLCAVHSNCAHAYGMEVFIFCSLILHLESEE